MNGITGLLRIDMPGGVVRLCDGAFFDFAGERYLSYSLVLGTMASVDALSEGKGVEIPALDISFNPPGPIAIATLAQAALQRRSVQFYIAEYDIETGLIVGTPELRFNGFVDQPAITDNDSEYTVSIVAVPLQEYFFDRDDGNGLTIAMQKSLFPDDTGQDQATGLGIGVAWGAESPRTNTTNFATQPMNFPGLFR